MLTFATPRTTLRNSAISTVLSTLVTLGATANALTSPSSATELPTTCETAEVLLELDSIRRAAGYEGENRCYRLDLADSGLLHLDITSGVRLDVIAGSALHTIARNATERLMVAESGTFYVTVRAEDPRQPLPAYHLASSFVPAAKGEDDDELEIDPNKGEDDDELEIDPNKGEDDDELEIDPNKLADIEAPLTCGSFAKGEDDDELEIDPNKGEDDDELEIDPNKSSCLAVRPLLERACRGAASLDDDHGDSLACATPIARQVTAELDNGWGDDADTFRFTIDGWQTLELSTRGEIATRGILYDRHGQQLTASGPALGDDGFRMVRTLGPGTYFLRIEGDGSAGAYQLNLETLD